MDILVIGCGVSGLTTGLCLLEAGYSVRIWEKDLPPHTTANIAAAVWHPFKAPPSDKVAAWGGATWQKLSTLQFAQDSGITMKRFLEVFPTSSPDPWWASAVEDFRHARKEELPDGYLDGYTFTAPVIDMSVYLRYLMREVKERKGHILQRSVTNLAEAFALAPSLSTVVV